MIDVNSTDKPAKSYLAAATGELSPTITSFATQFDEHKPVVESPVLSPQPTPDVLPPELSLGPCPWSQNGRLIGQRHFGPLVRNSLKLPTVRFIDVPDTDPPIISEAVGSTLATCVEASTLSVGQSAPQASSCVIL